MFRALQGKVGFDHPPHRRRAMARRAMPVPVLLATLALVLCTLLAVTVVSITIAQADTFSIGSERARNPLALAGFIGLLLAVVGAITAFAVRRPSRHT
jgi:hypothetical protein